jgi:uncharacterized protein YeaO (DUF488 family)
MTIQIRRIYDQAAPGEGYRVLVDRLWPRGVREEEARLDAWPREAPPSEALREAFHAGRLGWKDFRNRYLAELKEHRDELRPLAERARQGTVTLLFGSRDEEHNNAVVLAQYLRMLGAE